MSDRLGRLVTLTGVLFAALVLVAFFIGSESPGSNESSAKIASYYETHSSEVKASAIIFGLAFLVLVVFAAVLRSYLRRTPAAEGTSALLLAGSMLDRGRRHDRIGRRIRARQKKSTISAPNPSRH